MEHLTRADVDHLGLVLAEPEAQLALEDVRQLLVLVRVLRDDAALARGRPGRASSARSRSAAARGPASAAPSAGRPSGSASRSQERPELRDPLVDLRLVDEAEREPHGVGAAPVREEERAGDDPDALLDRAARRGRRSRRPPGGSATRRSRPAAASSARRPASSARAPPAAARPCAGRAPASGSAARRSSRGGRTPRTAAGRARRRTGRSSCFAATSRAETSAGPTAQPSRTPGQNVFDVVPAWTTTSGARLQRLGSDSSVKPSSR